MTARILGTYTPGSPEWHAARAGRIGGSEVGTVCGWSPYEARDDLLARKAGLEPARDTTPAMQRGTLLEPAIIAWLTDRHGLELDPGKSSATWVDDADDRLSYNPDGVTRCGVLLEAKTTTDRSAERGWGRAGSSKVPLHYAAQCQWGMGLLELTTCHLGVLAGAVNGRPELGFATYQLTYNPDVFAAIRRRVLAFLDDLDLLTGAQQ